jgi:FMN phosphatase YigB (HAD superfamily)
MAIGKIKVIVFDLDGTLYADTQHFDYYAQRLMEKLPLEDQVPFIEEYKKAREGKHPIKIGRVYDVKEDLVLVQNNQTVTEAFEWNGYRLTEERVKSMYPKPIVIDNRRMLSVGDLWWVPIPIARHYGLSSEQCHQAFLETREYMMSPEFKMSRVPGLKETLEELHSRKKLVLLTNSPEPDSRALLDKLGIENVFHKMIFSGKKPTHTIERFNLIKETFDVNFDEILSVGDNWVNEINPPQTFGVHTLFINQYQLGPEFKADFIVEKVEDIVPILRDILKQ